MRGWKSVIRKITNRTAVIVAVYAVLLLACAYTPGLSSPVRHGLLWATTAICLPVLAGYLDAYLPVILLTSAVFICLGRAAQSDFAIPGASLHRFLIILKEEPRAIPILVLMTSIAYYFGRFFGVLQDPSVARLDKRFFIQRLRANRGRFIAIIAVCLFFMALSMLANCYGNFPKDWYKQLRCS